MYLASAGSHHLLGSILTNYPFLNLISTVREYAIAGHKMIVARWPDILVKTLN
jgi:hypothetical protein